MLQAMARSKKTKKEVLQELLAQGMTQIVLVPGHDGVRVPEVYRHEPILRLNLSHRFTNSDLKVDWWGVRQTLTFADGAFHCQIPWDALFAVADPRRPDSAVMWPESMPAPYRDLLPRRPRKPADPAPTAPRQQPPGPSSPAPRGRTRAFTPRVIQGEGQSPTPRPAGAGDPSPDGEGPPPDPPPRKPPYLKVIK